MSVTALLISRVIMFLLAKECILLTRIKQMLPFCGRRKDMWLMAPEPVARDLQRYTPVRIKIQIDVQGVANPLTCDGETITINRHGALISAPLVLHVGMRVQIHVILTDKRALARVVYVDPSGSRRCGIELEKPENIWGVPLPPDDWKQVDPA
jgi:hypothetical protein